MVPWTTAACRQSNSLAKKQAEGGLKGGIEALPTGGADLWVELLGGPRSLPSLRQHHTERGCVRQCPGTSPRISCCSQQKLAAGRAAKAVVNQPWHAAMQQGNFVCPLPLAHTHCQASLVQYNGQAGARITTRRSAGRAPARHTLASGKQPPLCGRPGPFGRLHLHTKQHNIPQGHTSGTTLADLRGAADIVANPGSLSTPARHFPSPPRLALAG